MGEWGKTHAVHAPQPCSQSQALPSHQHNASEGQKKRHLEKHINLPALVHPLIRDTQPRLQNNPLLPRASSFGPAHPAGHLTFRPCPWVPFTALMNQYSFGGLGDGIHYEVGASHMGCIPEALLGHHLCQDHDPSTVLPQYVSSMSHCLARTEPTEASRWEERQGNSAGNNKRSSGTHPSPSQG